MFLARPLFSRLAPALLASLAVAFAAAQGTSRPRADARASAVRAENQPAADLGNGRYLNPILAGEYPDPTVVRVGSDYYMTHTPGLGSPGLLVWHSRDLVNWEPLGPAVTTPVGDIWAPDISFHQGLFYIYFPAQVRDPDGKLRRTSFVVTAKHPAGPWSAPVDLRVPGIDPGHVVDASGHRYLYLSGGTVARLSADGLRVVEPPVKVYDGWAIPAEWNVECKCLESPKLFTRGGFFYLVSAEGGTAGPSTSHMIIVARSKSPLGPWENMPSNPLLRTSARSERWWSQGHGTILEAADGSWWVVYHAFENGYRTLGRRTLMLPIAWTADGWPRIPAGAKPWLALGKPAGENVGHGMPLSDDFAGPGLGWPWRWWEAADAASSYSPASGDLRVRARGRGPSDAALLTLAPVNHSYEAEVEFTVPPGVEAGLLLQYSKEHFAGIGASADGLRTYVKSRPDTEEKRHMTGRSVFLRVRNIEHDVRLLFSEDGTAWAPLGGGFDMSGYHHDTFGEWGTLKIGLYAAGEGTAVFKRFRYRGL